MYAVRPTLGWTCAGMQLGDVRCTGVLEEQVHRQELNKCCLTLVQNLPDHAHHSYLNQGSTCDTAGESVLATLTLDLTHCQPVCLK